MLGWQPSKGDFVYCKMHNWLVQYGKVFVVTKVDREWIWLEGEPESFHGSHFEHVTLGM